MDPVTLIGRRVPPWAERRVTVLPAGATLEGADAPWPDALAVVELGAVEIVTAGGHRMRLAEGSVVCFAMLHAAVIRNAGAGTAVISALRRRPEH